jgi:hypothetical protein
MTSTSHGPQSALDEQRSLGTHFLQEGKKQLYGWSIRLTDMAAEG